VRSAGGGLARALGIAAIIVLFLISTVLFTPAFQSQPVTLQLSAFVGLFFNAYLLVASAVVLGWFVYTYFIGPRLRYSRLLRIRASQGRGHKNVERI
jgi:lysylphosphatidylglycerol synthetase-like protein (DUF2156 family)